MSTKSVDVPAEIKNCRPMPFAIDSPEWAVVEARFWKNVKKDGLNGCWSWNGTCHNQDSRGLLIVNRVKFIASRISWAIHHHEDPGQRFVLHHCDNPPCANPAHLFLGDHVDNSRDKCRKGRHHYQRDPNASYVVKNAGKIPFRVGVDVRHLAKLTAADVIAIRQAPREGRLSKCGRPLPTREVQMELVSKYPVTMCSIRDIVLGRSWKHLLPDYDKSHRIFHPQSA